MIHSTTTWNEYANVSPSEQYRRSREAKERLGIIPARRPFVVRSLPAPEAVEPEEPVEAPIVPPLPKGRVPLDMHMPCSARFLIKLASLRHGISVADIMSSKRTFLVSAARHEAMGLVYQHTQMSLPGIGSLFNRDHTTVLHGMKRAGRTEKLVDPAPPTLGQVRFRRRREVRVQK